ncbi:MAG: FdhF/YdeP family oxidoreductase [Phycisphaerales bacterium]
MPHPADPSPSDQPARGFGPESGGSFSQEPYTHPVAGWGAARSVTAILLQGGKPIEDSASLLRMNHPDRGFDCPGCAWPDDTGNLKLDLCENGVKHATWEMTSERAGREFFAAHTVAELSTWTDHALERAGRLVEPMRYDATSDRYVPISWEDAFATIGRHLRGLGDPNRASFYTSGRLSNEATFMFSLFVRQFGTNNLPDCSNMCHEASGRALLASIGTKKGTVDLPDLEQTDLVVLIGSNAASNTPRLLSALVKVVRRGGSVVHVNPLVEGAATRAIVPHEFAEMAMLRATSTGTLALQPRIAGDLALLRGVAKHLLECSATDPNAIDRTFIDQYAHGFEAYRSLVESTPWSELERQCGIAEASIREFGEIYRRADSAVIGWCLGLTQHEHSVDTIREIANLLLLRGNVGREGAGAMPIRGHSNVQGNRTCGQNPRPTEAWLQKLDAACGIRSPRAPGHGTVGTIEAMRRGDVKVFMAVGGNFALAAPDPETTFEALRQCDLTVQVSTRLNRSHLVHGREALVLPCLVRSERDPSAGGSFSVSVENSMSVVHLSTGHHEPASAALRSEASIVSGIAMATLAASPPPWSAWAGDLDLVRDRMASALEGFEDFNHRVRRPHGFRLRQPARERVFLTPSGKAEFSLAPLPDSVPRSGRLLLGTVRSHDQWNTTIYANDDRYRGVRNLRTLVFMNEADMRERGLAKFDLVDIRSFVRDGTTREVRGFRAIPYSIPVGCAMGYMPELNVLCGIGDFSTQSDQPLMKHLEVEIVPSRIAP